MMREYARCYAQDAVTQRAERAITARCASDRAAVRASAQQRSYSYVFARMVDMARRHKHCAQNAQLRQRYYVADAAAPCRAPLCYSRYAKERGASSLQRRATRRAPRAFVYARRALFADAHAVDVTLGLARCCCYADAAAMPRHTRDTLTPVTLFLRLPLCRTLYVYDYRAFDAAF